MHLLYRMALSLIPLGFTLWLVGMHLGSFHLAAAGFIVTALAAYAFTDDQEQSRQ